MDPYQPQIRRGNVYWLNDCPPLDDENVKRRPVIVIFVPNDGTVLVVAVSTKKRASEPDLVQLPSKADQPHTTSGLPKRSWAVPRWSLIVQTERLTELAGYISGDTLVRVRNAVINRQKPKGT